MKLDNYQIENKKYGTCCTINRDRENEKSGGHVGNTRGLLREIHVLETHSHSPICFLISTMSSGSAPRFSVMLFPKARAFASSDM